MKRVWFVIVALGLISGTVYADVFEVGGKQVQVRAPEGFARVTESMDAVYRLSLQMVDPAHDNLAFYIPEEGVPAALEGDVPGMPRYFILKMNKDLDDIVIGMDVFEELKSAVKTQNADLLEALSEAQENLKDVSAGIREEFDVDFAMQVSEMVPLESHYETEQAMAYSMYLNYGVESEGVEEEGIISGTVSFANLGGKVLTLYCYGERDDLQWTRDASKTWAESLISDNDAPPARTPGRFGIDWGEVLVKAVSGGLIAGFFGLIFSLFGGRSKKNDVSEKDDAADIN